MVVRKSKKIRSQRGSRSHGWGHPKKHRGSGSKGGVGNAGRGKHGSHSLSHYNLPGGIGPIGSKPGFVRPDVVSKRIQGINVGDLVNRMKEFEAVKAIKASKDHVEIDLTKTQYGKLLGSGKVAGKYVITVDTAAPRAIEKIEAANGKVTVVKVKQEKAAAPAPKAK